MNNPQADIQLAAVCGLFCSACSLYIGSTEEPQRLEQMAQRTGHSVQELTCTGCRSKQVSFFCKTCSFVKCAAEKGIEFCSQCPDYPCEDLREFQAQMPHRLDLWRSLDQIRDEGWQAWWRDAAQRHACPDCGSINSAYDLACRHCDHEPGSPFVAEHGGTVKRHMGK